MNIYILNILTFFHLREVSGVGQWVDTPLWSTKLEKPFLTSLRAEHFEGLEALWPFLNYADWSFPLILKATPVSGMVAITIESEIILKGLKKHWDEYQKGKNLFLDILDVVK